MSEQAKAESGPQEPQPELSEEEVFALYTKLAARVTNLRTILQEPEVIQPKEARDWAADVVSVMEDFQTLAILTRKHVIRRTAPQPPAIIIPGAVGHG